VSDDWYSIRDCFTVTGRGVVVVLDDADGLTSVVGDIVELVHADSAVRMRCAGVEMGDSRRVDGSSFPSIGLLLPGIRRFEVEPGDHVRVGVLGIDPKDVPDAVRVTHVPTGTVVEVDDQASAGENRHVALAHLSEMLRK
jgi:hypothetical protein